MDKAQRTAIRNRLQDAVEDAAAATRPGTTYRARLARASRSHYPQPANQR